MRADPHVVAAGRNGRAGCRECRRRPPARPRAASPPSARAQRSPQRSDAVCPHPAHRRSRTAPRAARMCVEHLPWNRLTNRSEDSPGGEWRHRNERECRLPGRLRDDHSERNRQHCAHDEQDGLLEAERSAAPGMARQLRAAAVNARPFQLMLSVAAITRAATSSPIGAPTAAAAAATAPASATAIARNGTTRLRGSRPTSVPRALSPPNPGCRPTRTEEPRMLSTSHGARAGTPRGTRRDRSAAQPAGRCRPRATQPTSRRGSSACVARSGAGRTPSPQQRSAERGRRETPDPECRKRPICASYVLDGRHHDSRHRAACRNRGLSQPSARPRCSAPNQRMIARPLAAFTLAPKRPPAISKTTRASKLPARPDAMSAAPAAASPVAITARSPTRSASNPQGSTEMVAPMLTDASNTSTCVRLRSRSRRAGASTAMPKKTAENAPCATVPTVRDHPAIAHESALTVGPAPASRRATTSRCPGPRGPPAHPAPPHASRRSRPDERPRGCRPSRVLRGTMRAARLRTSGPRSSRDRGADRGEQRRRAGSRSRPSGHPGPAPRH